MVCRDYSNSFLKSLLLLTEQSGQARLQSSMSIQECLDGPMLEDEEGEEGRGVERESDIDNAVDSAPSSVISDGGRTREKAEGIGLCLPGEK